MVVVVEPRRIPGVQLRWVTMSTRTLRRLINAPCFPARTAFREKSWRKRRRSKIDSFQRNLGAKGFPMSHEKVACRLKGPFSQTNETSEDAALLYYPWHDRFALCCLLWTCSTTTPGLDVCRCAVWHSLLPREKGGGGVRTP